MFVIIRTDKAYGPPTLIHEDDAGVIEEAKRLAGLHSTENSEFTIYELEPIYSVTGKQIIRVKSLKGAAK